MRPPGEPCPAIHAKHPVKRGIGMLARLDAVRREAINVDRQDIDELGLDRYAKRVKHRGVWCD